MLITLAKVVPSRTQMVRVLRKYSEVGQDVLDSLDDQQLHALATRLKHEVVVCDSAQLHSAAGR